MYKIISLLLLTITFFNGYSIKAKPGLLTYYDDEGKSMEIRLYGDEFHHYATDKNGYLLLENPENKLEYAVIDSNGIISLSGKDAGSGITGMKGKLVELEKFIPVSPYSFNQVDKTTKFRVNNLNEPGALKYRYSTSVFPTIGDPHSLVILVEYPDHGFNVENPKEYFDDFLNGSNFTRDGANGSCSKYYKDNSSGLFNPMFDVYGPVLLAHNRVYYGGGSEMNACQMVVEAVNALDPYVDFSQYDHNNDGYVDSVYIIYSDKGQADGGPAESVWPYSWELESEEIFLEADGVKFNMYGCSNELQADGQMEGIGTFTHEFGHVLGLPDLYNTDNPYDTSTPDEWSLMDSGSYNNDTRTPCGLSSFEKYSLGWINPQEILASGRYQLSPLNESDNCYILTTEENPDEFYMLEFRNKKGWDEFHPGHGMLVWHIDFLQSEWDENTLNNNPKRQRVEIFCADNDKSARNRGGDPFPGSENVTMFGENTLPPLVASNGKSLNVTSVYNINESVDKIEFEAKVTEFRGDSGIKDTIEDNIKINGNKVTAGSYPADIYEVTGRKIFTLSSGETVTLPKGIYFIGNKKVLIH